MKHNYLNNTPLDEAKRIYFDHLRGAGFGPRSERVKSTDGCGRVLTGAVYAKICSPHYNASAMDGVAVLARDTYGACEASPVTLTKEQYDVVDTGDPIPADRDAVIMVEDLLDAGAPPAERRVLRRLLDRIRPPRRNRAVRTESILVVRSVSDGGRPLPPDPGFSG